MPWPASFVPMRERSVLGRSPRDAVAAGMVGYMTQAAALYGELSIEENLRFFGELQDIPAAQASARVDDALGAVALLDRRRMVVGTLSGGLRTRVSLAATLLHRPAVLLLDEPTVGVDPALRRDFWDHFRALARSGTTILVSSHVMDEAARCDRLGLMLRPLAAVLPLTYAIDALRSVMVDGAALEDTVVLRDIGILAAFALLAAAAAVGSIRREVA